MKGFNFMCGIVGYIGKKHALPILIDGLKKLEYRGYDSAGVAYFDHESVNVVKSVGRIDVLETKLDMNSSTTTGIGHTRWATHGEPSEKNAHPHISNDGNVTIVHNGIIENYQELIKPENFQPLQAQPLRCIRLLRLQARFLFLIRLPQ